MELVAPEQLQERWDLQLAMQDGAGRTEIVARVLAASLALSWPRLRRYLEKAGHRYRADVREYGGHVVQYLASQRPPAALPEIVTAGQAAFDLVQRSLVSGTQVQAAEDFSGPQPAPSPSSSSTSSPTGESALGGSGPLNPSASLS